MPTNMMQLMAMIRNGNPKQIVMNMLNERAQDPLSQSLLKSIQNGNYSEVEKIARNVAKEKGFDFDKEFNNFKSM